MLKTKKFISLFSLVTILVFGAYLALTSNFGPDNDTYGMLSTFYKLINGEGYSPSRFTGYPVAEIGIGFVSFFFGSWLINLISLIFTILSLLILASIFIKPKSTPQIILFLLIALSNPVIFFDNILPMDYSWALFFLSLGMFFYKKDNIVISLIFFSLSVGSRPIFLLFVFCVVIFFKKSENYSLLKKVEIIVGIFFFSSLFYLPVWFLNSLDLNWLTSARPLNQGLFGLIARFLYKSWFSLGLFVTPICVYLFFKYRNQLRNVENFAFIISVILVNFAIFLYIPAERSYLQLGLIFISLLLSYIGSRFIALIIALNILSWIFIVQPLEFKMRHSDKCSYIEALDATINPRVTPGEYFIFMDGQEKAICFSDTITDKTEELLKGDRLI
jgi:uncharacterized membrane protein